MPTYEYKCEKCGHEFEVFQFMTEPPVKKCPECGGHVKKLIGKGSGLIFKGSGFYETDYKRKSSSKPDSSKSKGKDKTQIKDKK